MDYKYIEIRRENANVLVRKDEKTKLQKTYFEVDLI